MGFDQIFGGFLAICLVLFAIGGVRSGSLHGMGGVVYVRRAERPGFFWAMIALHLVGAAMASLVFL